MPAVSFLPTNEVGCARYHEEPNVTYPNTRPLRAALIANAVFSLASAALLILFPALVGNWLGVHYPPLLIAIGAGLVVFAADLLHQASRPRMASWRALYASAADFAWVAGSLLLVIVLPGLLSSGGVALVLAIAVVVLVFGCWQLAAAGRLHRLPDGRHYRHCLMVRADAPADAMWRVIGDLGNIARHMPSLRRSVLRGEVASGPGAVRECEDLRGRRWGEECTTYREGQRFDVRFLCDEPGFPFPASTMNGGWAVQPDGNGSIITVWWELAPKPRLLAPLLLPLLAWQVDRDFPKVIAAMANAANGRETAALRPPGVAAQLLPQVC
jgi:hypothetical protein